MIVAQGQTGTLLASWLEYPGGPAVDVTGITITITPLPSGSPVVGPTSAGVSHPATGIYTYSWAVPADLEVGTYLAVWNAVDVGGGAVQASEIVTVTGAGGPGGFPPKRLTTKVTTASGLVDPITIQVTVYQPDGTSAGPFTGVRDAQGLYYYDFVPSMAGRHIARWVTTAPDAADEEPFDVPPPWGEAGIISLTQAKSTLNIDLDDHQDDDEITGFIQAMTGPIERIVGATVRHTHREKVDGGHAIALNHTPVMSIVSITAIRTGVTAPALDALDVDGPTGIIERLDGGRIYGPLRIEYVAGRSVIEAYITLAANLILQHMWETQRGSQGVVRRGGQDEIWDPRFGFSIPRRAHELLGDQPPGVA
uniref:hypothetical protein n=1 Tax=Herbidospora sakaeratensis TaxID=564415 RepID=UPI000785427A|nr:hypothetical protein [Herbidospora sakaeratensis]